MRMAALLPPALVLLGLLAHTVLEGLAIGLQVRAVTICSPCNPQRRHSACTARQSIAGIAVVFGDSSDIVMAID